MHGGSLSLRRGSGTLKVGGPGPAAGPRSTSAGRFRGPQDHSRTAAQLNDNNSDDNDKNYDGNDDNNYEDNNDNSDNTIDNIENGKPP